MKEGWEYIAFKDVYPIKMGKTPPRGDKSFWDEKKETHNKWVSIADISNNEGKTIEDTKEYISDSAAEKINKVSKGSLLMSFKLSIGRMAFAGDDLYTNEAIIAIPKNDKYILRFIYFYLLSYDWLSLTEGNEKVKGATLNKSSIGKIQLPILSLSEQQSIVDYLDSAFAKIDAMKANAEKALNEAKALFQASLKEMLEPKEGWEEKALGDICSDIRYGTSTPSHENGEYKYLRMNNITNDGFLDVSHYKTISLPEKELEKCLVKRGDIIFNRTNSRELVGKSCVFTEDENMVIAGYLIRIRLKEGFEPQFITYSMNFQRSLGLFQHLIVGAVHQANISANNIQKVIINYPPLSEQKSIVATLDSLKSKVDRLQANYDKISQECDALKQAVLRQVFE